MKLYKRGLSGRETVLYGILILVILLILLGIYRGIINIFIPT